MRSFRLEPRPTRAAVVTVVMVTLLTAVAVVWRGAKTYPPRRPIPPERHAILVSGTATVARDRPA